MNRYRSIVENLNLKEFIVGDRVRLSDKDQMSDEEGTIIGTDSGGHYVVKWDDGTESDGLSANDLSKSSTLKEYTSYRNDPASTAEALFSYHYERGDEEEASKAVSAIIDGLVDKGKVAKEFSNFYEVKLRHERFNKNKSTKSTPEEYAGWIIDDLISELS